MVNETSSLLRPADISGSGPERRTTGHDPIKPSSQSGFPPATVLLALSTIILLACGLRYYPTSQQQRQVSVAFLGNSMFYFNDFPRFLVELSDNGIRQDSCLHGGASIPSLVQQGNGMFPQFQTPAAIYVQSSDGSPIFDYGACSAKMLLTGTSIYTPEQYERFNETDGMVKNPCREDLVFTSYIEKYYATNKPNWDYILINDNTRNPARGSTRQASLQTLQHFYIPWLHKTGATPVFLWTHAYSVESTPKRNMTGLDDVANFTSLTGAGYRAYAEFLQAHLPPTQKPRIAPSGLAFLTVYEENLEMWKKLFHNADHLHASPHGTFLQGCVVYHTLFGKMPDRDVVIRRDMGSLWATARMMQHSWEPPNPMLHERDATYLYDVAERVMNGHVPETYIEYNRGEVADTGDDS